LKFVTIAGGGPAGSAAALSALAEGAGVRVFEKSVFPRHKVCGEFVSPGARAVLEDLGAWNAFAAAGPAAITRVSLVFGTRIKTWRLREAGYGISRYRFDQLLLDLARERGAEIVHGMGEPAGAAILAHGRRDAAQGPRLFGFKAHFEGPASDTVALHFFEDCYAGVSSVEGGRTNVCGLAPESVLRAHGFRIEPVLERNEVLAARIRRLSPVMDWMITGPLVFRNRMGGEADRYLAGDALGFIDPFTGTGMLAALITGLKAGRAAVRGIPPGEHLRDCRASLMRAYRAAGLFRAALGTGLAGWIAPFVPGPVLFAATRPDYSSGNKKTGGGSEVAPTGSTASARFE
jgi:hypothetical protein